MADMSTKKGGGLPPALRFLNWGWWVLHLIAIPVVFLLGYWVGWAARQ